MKIGAGRAALFVVARNAVALLRGILTVKNALVKSMCYVT